MITWNEAEELLAIHLTELGITFERQYRYVPGREFRADFAIPGYQLLIQVEGGVYNRRAHGSVKGILADIERGNLAALHGWRVLRFTPHQVKAGEAKVFTKKMLGTRHCFTESGNRGLW